MAERMDMMLEDDDTPYSLEWYFWEMVKNCGLYDYNDEALFNPRHEEEVDSILEPVAYTHLFTYAPTWGIGFPREKLCLI